MNKSLIASIVVGTIIIIGLGIGMVQFNNGIIKLNNLITNESEGIKVNYSQCLIAISEINDVAKGYKKDLMEITKQSMDSIESFSDQSFTLLSTQILPNISPNLRENVQIKIGACRNQFGNTANNVIKPLYTEYNNRVQMFPGSFFNIIYGHKNKEFNMPKSQRVNEIFNSNIDEKIQGLSE